MSAVRPDARQLAALARRVLWLSHWMVHHANHVRPKAEGEVKVGGHQASSASMVQIMTALYFRALRPEDRVAVKPHASPVFHAIQYLAGNQTRGKLEAFRGWGGAQSYPSRTKDGPEVDFSTGSVGLGVAITAFASLVQDYLHAKPPLRPEGPMGRMVALIGDAELDEGNVYEALQEGWKHDLRNVWWVIDYNRQSARRGGARGAVGARRGGVPGLRLAGRAAAPRGAPARGLRRARAASGCASGSRPAPTPSTRRSPTVRGRRAARRGARA